MFNDFEISLMRDCEAILIPDGIPISLYHGDSVHITQVLGGMFTVMTHQGSMVRIDGKDADALGQTIPEEAQPISAADLAASSVEELLQRQLRTCYDPEIPVNIVDLGLVYECKVFADDKGNNTVQIEMTLTAPGCGMGEILKQDVERKVKSVPSVTSVEVQLVFDPAWDRSMMSEAARLQLGML